MKTLSGAIFLLTAEQAFAHAHLVQFPHQVFVRELLLPISLVLTVLGIGFLIWGLLTDRLPSAK